MDFSNQEGLHSPQPNSAERRTNIRVTIPATVTLDGNSYAVDDWSTKGLKIRGFKQPVKLGDCLPIGFFLHLNGDANIEISTLIEVIWHSTAEGKMGAQFLNLTQLERDLLQHAISDMNNAVPAAPDFELDEASQAALAQSITHLERSAAEKRLDWQVGRKSLVAIAAYIGAGGMIGGIALAALAQTVSKMEIKSAVVADQTEPVVATHRGVLRTLHTQPGAEIQVGQPLFEVSNSTAETQHMSDINALIRNKISMIDDLQQKLELSRLELASAQLETQEKATLQQQEVGKMQLYTQIASSKLSTAQARVESLRIEHQVAQTRFDRLSQLLREGAISQQATDTASAKLAEVTSSLRSAESELAIAQTAMKSLQQGQFYNGHTIVGELPTLKTHVVKRQQRVQLANQKIHILGVCN